MTNLTLEEELRETRARLAEAEETLRALHSGEVDAVLVDGEAGLQVFTLKSAAEPYRRTPDTRWATWCSSLRKIVWPGRPTKGMPVANRLSVRSRRAATRRRLSLRKAPLPRSLQKMSAEAGLKPLRPELRTNAYAGHGRVDRVLFELYALAASTVGKCHFCVASHYALLKESGMTVQQLRDVGRIAAVVNATAQVLSAQPGSAGAETAIAAAA